MHRHRHVRQHLVVDELVLLREEEFAVQDKHAPVFGGVEDVDAFVLALPRGNLPHRLHRETHVLRVLVRIPKLHFAHLTTLMRLIFMSAGPVMKHPFDLA